MEEESKKPLLQFKKHNVNVHTFFVVRKTTNITVQN